MSWPARLRWSDVALGAALVIFLLLGARLLDIGASDLGIAGMFSTDEQLAGELVRAMIHHGDLGVSHFFSYGPLDLYAARALLVPYSVLRSVNDEQVLVALRLVSLLAGAGSLIVTFLLGRRLWNAETGAVAAILLATSPTMLAWSTTAHPDLLQLLFLLLGLRCAIEIPAGATRNSLIAASTFAGLAFATKYAGIILLPIIWFAAALPFIQAAMGGGHDGKPSVSAPEAGIAPGTRGLVWRKARLWLVNAGISSATFLAVFLIVDPSVLREPRRFVSQARVESELAHHGHVFSSAVDPTGWLRLLVQPTLLGGVSLALALAGLLIWTSRALRRMRSVPWSEAFSLSPLEGERSNHLTTSPCGQLVLAAWTLGYLCLLWFWTGDRQERYALPVMPCLLLFAAATAAWLAQKVRMTSLVLVAYVAIAGLPAVAAIASYEQTQLQRMQRPAIASRVEAGRWLGIHLDHRVPVLRDAYSYVPSDFGHVSETFGLSRAQIDTVQPRVIVTDADVRGRFLDPAGAQSYRDGPAAFQEIASTYAALEAGSMPCYPLLAAFGPVRIYGSTSPGSGC